MAESKRRAVASSLITERPPVTSHTTVDSSLLTTLTLFVFRPTWRYRYELLLVSTLGVLTVEAWWRFGSAGVVGVGLLVAGLVCIPVVRRLLFGLLHGQSVRRRFDQACRYALVVSMNDRTPIVRRVRKTPAGDVLAVRMPPGLSTLPLVDASEVLASNMAVREITVVRDAGRADLATVSIIRRDPLGDPAPVAWPNRSAVRLSAWEPIPVGFDEHGEIVLLLLPEKMVLFGAETGGGKSVALSQLVATAALDPDCRLILLDGKQVELAFWRDCAEAVVGPSVPEAIAVLNDLRSEMNRRYSVLLEAGKRKIERDSDMPLHVVVCDELAFYLNMGERKECQEFERCLRDLVARGRAAGIVVIAATQKPSHDVIPTSIRDLFAVRWALRCTTPQASDTVLGQGWASQDFDASSIDQSCRGVGYLLHEGEVPVRLRSYFLSDDDLRALAAQGSSLRVKEVPAATLKAVG